MEMLQVSSVPAGVSILHDLALREVDWLRSMNAVSRSYRTDAFN